MNGTVYVFELKDVMLYGCCRHELPLSVSGYCLTMHGHKFSKVSVDVI